MADIARMRKRFKRAYWQYLRRTLSPPSGVFRPDDPASDFVQSVANKHEAAWLTAAERMFGSGTQAIGKARGELGPRYESELLVELGSEYSMDASILERALTMREGERDLSQARMLLYDCLEGRVASKRECAEVADSTNELLANVKAAMDVSGATPLLKDLYRLAEEELAALEHRLEGSR